MRKLFDSKAGATFHAECPDLTINTRKDGLEFIAKLSPGIYLIINMKRRSANEVLLYANWGDYFNRLQNPDTQLPRIKKTCPTLYAVLMEQDEDNVFQFRRKNSGTFESGLGIICKVAADAPLFALIDNHMLQQVSMLVNKHVVIYEELSNNPPFPAWKDGLDDLWN